MIVNIRGTSGSGKTYAVRDLMTHYEYDGMTFTYFPGTKENGGHRAGYHEGRAPWRIMPLRILGFYGGAACGGCDGIRTQLAVETMIREAVKADADCIFEGLLISHLRSRWATLPAELGVPWRFIFLDVTAEECVQRAIDRRMARGDQRPFNPRNTLQKHKDISRRYDDMSALGLDCVKIAPDNVGESIYGYLDPARPYPTVCAFRESAGDPPPPQGAGAVALDERPHTGQVSFL